jgi:hypothetical protein
MKRQERESRNISGQVSVTQSLGINIAGLSLVIVGCRPRLDSAKTHSSARKTDSLGSTIFQEIGTGYPIGPDRFPSSRYYCHANALFLLLACLGRYRIRFLSRLRSGKAREHGDTAPFRQSF